ncbi:MAG TPA: hypothetical protein V6D14_05930 [Coleofasciculaceae cyanobacterium]|jgi:hypothetical protein
MSRRDGDRSLIDKLTPEQEALISVYRDKAIALSTKPIARQKACLAVKAAYALMGLPEPKKILFLIALTPPKRVLQANGRTN